MLTNLLTFAASIFFLIAAARFFTKAAEEIGRFLGMSEFAIGVLIVSVGTSLPELITAVVSVVRGMPEVVAGNVIGSSLSNLLFVLGMTAMTTRGRIDLGDQYIFIDLNYLIGAVFLFGIISFDGVISIAEGFFAIIVYVLYTFYLLQSQSSQTEELHGGVFDENTQSMLAPWGSFFSNLGLLIVAAIGIYFAAHLTLNSLSAIAESFGVSRSIVSVTLLSFGTTLPELVVSVAAARAGKGAMAFGNVLGSCIFNALMICGLASCFGHLTMGDDLRCFALPVFAGATLLFYLLVQDKKISRYEGALFVVLYFLIVAKIGSVV